MIRPYDLEVSSSVAVEPKKKCKFIFYSYVSHMGEVACADIRLTGKPRYGYREGTQEVLSGVRKKDYEAYIGIWALSGLF